MIFILLGPPGSGKGTQGKIISKKYGIPYISSGDLLRDLSKQDNEFSLEIMRFMNEGKLIPDAVMSKIFISYIKEILNNHKGIILDGYPRTLNQVKDLEELITELEVSQKTIIIELVVSPEESLRRILSRITCPNCKSIFQNNEGKLLDLICTVCGSKLSKRSDDEEKTVLKRLNEYEQKTRELHNYYFNNYKESFITVSGENSIEVVANLIDEYLKKLLQGYLQ